MSVHRLGRGIGRTYDPAESEEGTALEHATGHVTAVVTLAGDALVAREFLADGLFAAHEEEEHDGELVERECSRKIDAACFAVIERRVENSIVCCAARVPVCKMAAGDEGDKKRSE